MKYKSLDMYIVRLRIKYSSVVGERKTCLSDFVYVLVLIDGFVMKTS